MVAPKGEVRADSRQSRVLMRPGDLAAARHARARRKWMAAWLLPSAVLITWWLVTRVGTVHRFFLPSPAETLRVATDLLTTMVFWQDLTVSLSRIIAGFILALAFALPSGILMERSPLANSLIEPLLSFVRYVPMPAVVPLMILWFGSGEWGKVMAVCLAVYFQLALMIADAIANIPQAYDDIAHSVRATPWQRLLCFTLPAASPAIWDSLRINVGLAWATLVFAEILGATSGLGYLIVRSQRFLLTEQVFVVVFVIGLLGIITDKAFEWCYRRWFPWSIQALRSEEGA